MERTLPQCREAERVVVGSILLEPSVFDDVIDIISGPNDFTDPAVREIYKHVLDRHRRGESIDSFAVELHCDSPEFRRRHPEFGYAADLMRKVANVANVREHAQAVANTARKRAIIEVMALGLDQLWRDSGLDDDGAGIAAEVARKFDEIQSSGRPGTAKRVGDMVAEEIEAMRRRAAGEVVGIPSPWPELDSVLGGFEPGRLYVLAGRPALGKSALAQQLVTHMAAEYGTPVLYVSLEMGDSELARRHIAADTGLPGHQLRKSPDTLLPRMWRKVEEAGRKAAGIPLWFETSSNWDVNRIRDQFRSYNRREGVQVLVVDHLGLVGDEPDTPQGRASRAEKLGHISRALKVLAHSQKVVVIALAQLNRNSERDRRAPQMSDLRDSGRVEEDADCVVLLHRAPDQDRSKAGPIELLVRKNRTDGTGDVHLEFRPPTTSFHSPTAPDGTY